MIIITREKYIQLREAQITLNSLYKGGVDNWEWYGSSLPSDEEFKIATEEANEHDDNEL